jgi:hypothetical protein
MIGAPLGAPAVGFGPSILETKIETHRYVIYRSYHGKP